MVIKRKEKLLTITKQYIKTASQEWLSKDLPNFTYVFKSVTACLMALSLCIVFNLSMPQTSVFTVFIVMQPFSGPVFSKVFIDLLELFWVQLWLLLL